jgi:hypothetical protein
LLLDCWVASDEVVKALRLRLRSEDGESQIVVLKVETNAWEVNFWFNAYSLELRWVANA